MSTNASRRIQVGVFIGMLGAGVVASYGGIRSPDEEVVFSMCEALHDRRSAAIEDKSRWTGFGLAPAQDGQMYSIFGPGESIACVPFLTAARLINRTGWYVGSSGPNPSFYTSDGYESYRNDQAPSDAVLHAERSIASFLNILVTAFGAIVFFRLAKSVGAHDGAAMGATALYSLGTLAWPYAGTFFSEPLTCLLAMLSLLACLSRSRWSITSGLLLGLATATHVSAILYVPFFAMIGARAAKPLERRATVAWFSAGLAIVLLVLAAYNFWRFGNPIETGRTVDTELSRAYAYGKFVAPWQGLYGLLASPGKGLLFYSPALVLSLWAWPSFRRAQPQLAGALAVALCCRVVFIASRSDWHGGFCLGPRLLLLALPFLLLSTALWLQEQMVFGRLRALVTFVVFSTLCVMHQWALVISEPFSAYQDARVHSVLRHEDIFSNNDIYMTARLSPGFHPLSGERGPWVLDLIPVSNWWLWMGGAVSIATVSVFLILRIVGNIKKSSIPRIC